MTSSTTLPERTGSSPHLVSGSSAPATTRSPSRWLVPLGLVVVALVLVEAALGPVGFGLTGRPLAMLVAAGLFGAAGAGFLRADGATDSQAMAMLAVMTAAVLVMHGVDPSGPVIGLFLIAAFAPLRPHQPLATALLVVGTLGFNLEQLFLGGETVALTVATVAGVAFFVLVGTLMRREREQRERVDRLLVELELSRQAEQAASAMAERARLARDVHDVLAHSLSGLALQLEGARLLAASTPTDPRLEEAVGRAQRLARNGLVEARRAVGALRGDGPPGPELIPVLVEEHRLASQGSCRFTQTGQPAPLSREAGLALYRAAQEALSNVRKHAGNASVDVDLTWRQDEVELVVADHAGRSSRPSVAPGAASAVRESTTGHGSGGDADGAGGGDAAGAGGGYGLAGMAERAHLIGGRVTAGPTADGFRVSLVVPIA